MLLSDKIATKWCKRNRKYFVDKGYEFTKYNDEFEVSINDIEKGSSLNVRFICDYCNGDNQVEEKDQVKPYNNLMKSRGKTDKDCCSNKECIEKKSRDYYIRKINEQGKTIRDTHPHLIKEWSSKNETTPSQHASGSRFKIIWECENGHEWLAFINNRCKRESGCPYCAGVLISKENSLPITDPNLFKEWNHKKNTNLDPFQVSKGTNKKVWWICKNGHEWDATVSSRSLGVGCPYCSCKKVSSENCLATTNPKISKQWNYDKNLELTPFDVVSGSGKKVWWVCEKGHEWESTINSRNQGRECPYCTGKMACNDNCLATLRPDLLPEWSFIENIIITPYDVTLGSDKKVWWTCKECSFNWKSSIYHRVNGCSCPQCNQSKGEKRVRKFLELNNYKFISQYEFDGLVGIGGKNLRFDFAIFENINNLNLLVEYDGEFHHKKLYEDDSHEIIVEHDKRKNEYCKDKNIPLLRIPYWDFDSIEEILIKELVKYKLTASNS